MNNLRYIAAGLLLSATSFAFAGSELTLKSDAGDYIGQGKVYSYTDKDSTFKYTKNYSNGISVSIKTGTTSWWSLDLAAPGKEQIKPGLYENAERFPFNSADKPGLNFSGNGRGCNTLTGKFHVYDVSYDDAGVVTALNASFEQHCEGNEPALRGTISYNLTPPLGADAVGMTAAYAVCQNRTSGQQISFQTTSQAVDCKKHGLQVNPNDVVGVAIFGAAQ